MWYTLNMCNFSVKKIINIKCVIMIASKDGRRMKLD